MPAPPPRPVAQFKTERTPVGPATQFKLGQSRVGPPQGFVDFHVGAGMEDLDIDGLWWATPPDEQNTWLEAEVEWSGQSPTGAAPPAEAAKEVQIKGEPPPGGTHLQAGSLTRPSAYEGTVIEPLGRNIPVGHGEVTLDPTTMRMEPVKYKRPAAKGAPRGNLSRDFWASSQQKTIFGLGKGGIVHPNTGKTVRGRELVGEDLVWNPDAVRWEVDTRGERTIPQGSLHPTQPDQLQWDSRANTWVPTQESLDAKVEQLRPPQRQPAAAPTTQARVPLARPGRFAGDGAKKNVEQPPGPQSAKAVQPTGQVVASNKAATRKKRAEVVQKDVAKTFTPQHQQKQAGAEQLRLSRKQESQQMFKRYRDQKEKEQVAV